MTDRETTKGRTREWLERLPEQDPPERIWARILETRLSEERRRRRRLTRYAGVAAVLVAMLAMWSLVPTTDARNELESMMAHARLLEERLLTYDSRAGRLDPVVQASVGEQRAALLNIDQALARAYAENRSESEIQALWRQRLDLLNGMVEIYEAGPGSTTSI